MVADRKFKTKLQTKIKMKNKTQKKVYWTALALLAALSLSAAESQPRGYTIPTIDLSAEKHRQIIVDREKGQYLGHPTTVLLEDGKTMLKIGRASCRERV